MLRLPNCKINLGLDVLRRRTDGYHDLCSLMLPVRGMCDAVELIPAPESSLKVFGAAIDCPPEQNLCMRALRLMQSRHGAGQAAIFLHKVIPSGAGLGGGSADAAAVILAANELFGLGLSQQQMERAAAELGSDVPFFIADRPVIATGRGEVLTPFDIDLRGLQLLIVKPSIHISTAEAYAGITPRIPVIPLEERLKAPIGTWRETITNAFEEHIFAKYPLLPQLKEELYAAGAIYAAMSGSGSALFGIFVENPKFIPKFALGKLEKFR